ILNQKDKCAFTTDKRKPREKFRIANFLPKQKNCSQKTIRLEKCFTHPELNFGETIIGPQFYERSPPPRKCSSCSSVVNTPSCRLRDPPSGSRPGPCASIGKRQVSACRRKIGLMRDKNPNSSAIRSHNWKNMRCYPTRRMQRMDDDAFSDDSI